MSREFGAEPTGATAENPFETQHKSQDLINLDFDAAESNIKSVRVYDNLVTVLKF